MKIAVFLGPSLSVQEAKAIIPDALYFPPAKQGDVLSVAVNEHPNAIVLIDGCFGQSLSVWHKELLFCLSNGIHVFGASSMGAIRAAECESFGMVGIGSIFRQFKNGSLEDDDEVAVAHSLDGAKCLSIPMVNIRATLENIPAMCLEEFDDIASDIKALFYPDRTIAAIPKIWREAFKAHYVDVKKDDALEALRWISTQSFNEPFKPSFQMEDSHLFDAQYERDRTVIRDDGPTILAGIDSFAALHDPTFNWSNWNAANRASALVLAEILKLDVDPEEIKDEAGRFTAERGIQSLDDLDAWLNANDLSTHEFEEMMREQTLIRKVHKSIRTSLVAKRNTKTFLDYARILGNYPTLADESATQEMIVKRLAPDFMQEPLSQEPIQIRLSKHIDAIGTPFTWNLPEWIKEAGFHSLAELAVDLDRAAIARGKTPSQSQDSPVI